MAGESAERAQASSDALRAQLLARAPSWYTPYGHLAGTIGVGLATLSLALYKLRPLEALELATIPIAFVFSNLIEWWAHKHVMHRRRRFMPVLYARHTPEHHRVYRYEDMAIRSVQEFRLVLIPAAGVLGIVLLSAPAAWVVGFFSTYNSGWLFLMTTALYVVGYELTHLCYHLPEDSIVYRIRLLRTLREHHARHHVPTLMQSFNFNVTVPLGDLVFGTIAPSEQVTAVLARDGQR